MILLELFLGFLEIGLFSFGGAYGAIPLIREAVLSYGWIEEEKLYEVLYQFETEDSNHAEEKE